MLWRQFDVGSNGFSLHTEHRRRAGGLAIAFSPLNGATGFSDFWRPDS
jgi:hypothetical protein